MTPVAFITGASSGIGAACAERFLAEGWRVVALARRRDRLGRLAAAHPDRVLPLVADVTREADLEAAVVQFKRWQPTQPRLDALVHSAGEFLVAPIEGTPPAEFERLWRLIVWAKFALTRELLPLLTAAGPGPRPAPRAVVHLGSLATHQDFPEETAYMSAMHAVTGLARAQDVELRARGIRVSVVSPGLVRTPLTERHFRPDELAAALPPGAIADSVWTLVRTIRAGGYIPEIFHTPGHFPEA